MGLRDHVICDSDLHVMEPPDLWERYIDPAYAHAAPAGSPRSRGDMRVRVKNHVMLRMGATRPMRVEGRKTGWQEHHDNVYAASEARGWDAQSQVDAMDAEGLDLAVLFPSRGLFVLGLDSSEQIGADGLEPEFATAIARAYNDWLKDFCDHAPDRMFGAGMVAAHDVPGAVEEARRCVEELGFKAIFLPPAAVNRRPWHHRAYDPLWAEIERLGVPLAFHGGGQTYLTPDFGLEVLDKLMLWHTFSQPLGIQFVTACLCGGGVLERFPTSRSRSSRATAPGRRGSSTASTSTGSGRAGTKHRADDAAIGVLQAQLLGLGRGRRGDGAALRRDVRRREADLLDRLPPRRLEIPPRSGRLRQASARRREQSPDRERQLVGALRHPARQEDLTPAREPGSGRPHAATPGGQRIHPWLLAGFRTGRRQVRQ